MNLLPPLLEWLYPCVAVVGLLGYLPQIYRIYVATGPVTSISLVAWGIWLVTWIISTGYAWLVAHDIKFALVSLVNVFGQSAVIGLTVHNRYMRFRKAYQQTLTND
jgi:hypothetical protein